MKADHIVEALTGDSGWKDMIPQVDSSDFPTQWVPSAYERSIIDAQAKEIEKLRAQLRHLEELAEADRAGRLVVLPCKVGDVVYGFPGKKTILPMVVKWIETYTNGWCIAVQYAQMAPRFYRFSDFGKTVFLTHEEAEAALEAKRDG